MTLILCWNVGLVIIKQLASGLETWGAQSVVHTTVMNEARADMVMRTPGPSKTRPALRVTSCWGRSQRRY